MVKEEGEKFVFTALGVYNLGYYLERLEWAIATISNSTELATFFGDLRFLETIAHFEDIGREAKSYHNSISSLKKQEIEPSEKNTWREARARWHALARERIQDLYLVTSEAKIDPKHLMRGIGGFLSPEHFALLNSIEIIDLTEACHCILIGSATAAEHIALRAAESLLRRWYEHQTGNKLERKTWGTVLDRLVQEYPEEKKRPKEIILLGYLKQRRDEVAHPDRVSTLIEAEATLMNVCSLIEGIKPVLATLSLSPQPNAQLAMPKTKKGKGKGRQQ